MSLPNNKEFVVISINDTSVSYPPSAKLYCNLCNCNLVLVDPQAEEWFCNRCKVSYYPNKGEKVKRANKFETPSPLTDKHGNITGEKVPLVASINDNDAKEVSSISYFGDKKKMPASFKEMERHGLKITSWEERVG
jgi:hypothetical protein